MSRYKYFVLLILALLLSCNQLEKIETEAVTIDAESKSKFKEITQNENIKIGPLQKKNVNRSISCVGQIEIPPTEISSIHSKVAGHVTYLKYLPGDYVKKGSLLSRVENPDLIVKQRIFLETKSNLDLAQKDLNRKQLLIEGNATPRRVFEESQSKYNFLSAKYGGLKKELELIGINLTELENNSNYQSSISIYSSQSGYVHEVSVNKGQMIVPETQLMEIADIDHIHLELQILSKDIGSVELEQKVIFTIPGSSKEYHAEVVKINPMIHNNQSTLQVHCHINHKDKKIFVAGLFVNAELQMSPTEQEGLPLSGVLKEGEDYFAFQLKNQNLTKTTLSDVKLIDDFVVFSNPKVGDWVLEGAYYVE